MQDETWTLKGLDAVVGGGIFASVVGWIPEATAFVGFVYVCIRVFETKTVQCVVHWVRKKLRKEKPPADE